MKILLTGASGFIGRHLLTALLDAGHDVVCAVRKARAAARPGLSQVVVDFNKAQHPQDWMPALNGVDVVVNAVGILRELPGQTFDTLHRAAPIALFTAAAEIGVRHIVQISALGADEQAASRYHLSKKAADDFLLALPVQATIAQPSLVYGPGGASAALFERYASMPLIPLPRGGTQQVQPVHIDDVVSVLLRLIESAPGPDRRVAIVGPEPISLRSFYAALRRAMGFSSPARFVAIPMPIMRMVARIGNRLPGGFLDTETLDMLQRGNTADAAATQSLLGHRPRAPRQFVPSRYADAVAAQARLRWLLPMLRWAVGLVWIVTGLVSLGLYPVEQSYALLARSGVPLSLQPLFLYGAAALDVLLGVLALLPRRSRLIWLAQATLVLAYTAIITVKLPEFWLHPYGPVLKNLPFLAALWILYELEDRTWTT